MTCAACGSENRSGREFCLRCGRALAPTCAACGVPNEPEAAFCGECGTAFAGAGRGGGERPPGRAASAGGPGPIAERRLVSILFVDLVGFTPFAEERDAEEVRETLSRYFELAAGVIARREGAL